MPVQFSPAEVPGLKASERAFTLESGETFVVRITRNQPDSDDKTVNLKIQAAEVDPLTGDIKRTTSGVPIRIPAHVRSVSLSALADNAVTIENEIADAIAQAAERFRNHTVALKAWEKVPVEEVSPLEP